MTDVAAAGPITIDDVRAALDAGATNASAVRAQLGRGSFSTIQKHIDAVRAEAAAAAAPAEGGAVPAAPAEVVGALWSAAWAHAQARTAGALADSLQRVERMSADLAQARADAAAALEAADAAEAAQAAALARAQATEAALAQHQAQATEAAQTAGDAAAAAAAAAVQVLAEERAARALERAQSEAGAAALRGELDRLVSQLADLRAALGARQQ